MPTINSERSVARSSSVPAYRRTVEAVADELETDLDRGLRSAQVQERLARYGTNELEAAPEEPAWRRFVAQFNDTLVRLLLVATVVSTVVWFLERDSGLPYDAIAIAAIVLLNALLGFIQEERAARAVAALRELTTTTVTVVRDGRRQRSDATELVPGDVVLLAEGDAVPADARLAEVAELRTVEGALTGESLPTGKGVRPIDGEDVAIGDRDNCVFAGTTVASGRARAIVTATGMATELGRIAGMLEQVEHNPTPLQVELDRVGRRLGTIVVATAIVVAAAILVTQRAALHDVNTVVDVLLFAVALAVAAVPEGLPAVVTSTLAIGVQRMARRNAVVRQLPAVETLGSATVIASDKTGTLTRNQMTVRTVVTAAGRTTFSGTGWDPAGEPSWPGGSGREPPRWEVGRAVTAAARCNDASLTRADDGAWTILGDPTEGALLVVAQKAGLDLEELDARLPRVAEQPFSSERKRMSTVHRDGDRYVLFVKGATDLLLERCTTIVGSEPDGTLQREPLDEGRRRQLVEDNAELTGRAMRTLVVAERDLGPADGPVPELTPDDERDLAFLAIIGMIDPPRPAAAPAVTRARSAGIRPLLITGDHPATALAIAAEVGIVADAESRVLVGRELEHLDDDELDAQVEQVSVFARVDPAHKLRIVGALQRRGHVVAMTGDGVNDAPALQTADIGVAMGVAGTDVSKEASDIVLLDDDFATIVAAVEEGRAIFANIRKFLRYLLASNAGEVLTMFFGVVLAGLLGLDAAQHDGSVVLPLLATQILWINLVTDGLPALALGLDPADPDIMERPPRPPSEGVLTGATWTDILVLGAVMAVGTLAVLDAALPGGILHLSSAEGTLVHARTLTFTTLVLFQLYQAFLARAGAQPITRGLGRNRWLWGAVAVSLALQIAVVNVPALQRAFSTTALSLGEWLVCAAVASSVVWVGELVRVLRNRVDR